MKSRCEIKPSASLVLQWRIIQSNHHLAASLIFMHLERSQMN